MLTPKVMDLKYRDMLRDKKFEVMFVGSFRDWKLTATIYSIPGFGYVLEQVIKHVKQDANVGPLLQFETFEQAKEFALSKVKRFNPTPTIIRD